MQDKLKWLITIIIIKVIVVATGVLTVEMGVLTVEEKLIHVYMLRLEVGSKGLRAERERDVKAFGRADIVES
jgi:hypothetical protein